MLLPVSFLWSVIHKITSFFEPVGADTHEGPAYSSAGLQHLHSPHKEGFCEQRLARLGSWVREQVSEGRVAGMMVGMARHGRLVFLEKHGLQSVESAVPLRNDTIFRIYSMTKPITSVAIMMLYEQGRLQLDEPIAKYAKMFAHMRVAVSGKHPNIVTEEAASPITFQHLLTHTAGFTYGFVPDEFDVHRHYEENKITFTALEAQGRRQPDTLATVCERLAAAPLLFHPGKKWNYGVSTDVLGYLVEVISGQSFEDFVRTHILQPLGMVDTDFFVPAEKRARFAACYLFDGQSSSRPAAVSESGFATRGAFRLMDDGAAYMEEPTRYASGGGGLASTMADYLRFCQMLLNGGALDGVRLLAPSTVHFMLQNHLEGDMGDMGKPTFLNMNRRGQGFGLGFAVVLQPPRLGCMCEPGDASWGGMASTFFFIDPRNGLAAVLLTQLVPSSTYNFRRPLRTLIYQALVGRAPFA